MPIQFTNKTMSFAMGGDDKKKFDANWEATFGKSEDVVPRAEHKAETYLAYEEIGRVCHEANTAYCIVVGEPPPPHWDDAPTWMKESTLRGVRFAVENPEAPPSAQHDQWLAEKLEQGWKYGPVKDATAKTHPCCLPYEKLPQEQQRKDLLFKLIVMSLTAEFLEP